MQEENKIFITQEGYKAILPETESVELNLNISKDTMQLLEGIAKKRDLSVISIVKFFIGKGIRDLEPELAKETAIKRFKTRKKFKEENAEVDLVA